MPAYLRHGILGTLTVFMLLHVVVDAMMPSYDGTLLSLFLGGIVGGYLAAASFRGFREPQEESSVKARPWWSVKG